MLDLHTPTWRAGETWDKFNGRLAANIHIHGNSKTSDSDSLARLNRQMVLETELIQLQQEQREYEAEKAWHKKDDEPVRWSSKQLWDASLVNGKEICRREHYRKWLATGDSNIPSHDKHPAYGGYPQSESLANQDRNATPRPSRLRGQIPSDSNHNDSHDRHQENSWPT